jgi:hypothetical protein
MTTEATPVNNVGGWTGFDRFIGTCKGCKTTVVATIADEPLNDTVRPCPSCGKNVTIERVFGSVKDSKKCDARCWNAKRSDCECSCGGKNHGGGS